LQFAPVQATSAESADIKLNAEGLLGLAQFAPLQSCTGSEDVRGGASGSCGSLYKQFWPVHAIAFCGLKVRTVVVPKARTARRNIFFMASSSLWSSAVGVVASRNSAGMMNYESRRATHNGAGEQREEQYLFHGHSPNQSIEFGRI
jgi:hypothetical protein